MLMQASPVRVNDAGDEVRLCLVHAVDGTFDPYREFAQGLSPDVQLLFFNALGMQGECNPIEHVEDIARIYNRGLVEACPDGPYRICGHSAGGLIAYEMARQLIVAGHDVESLGLFDTGIDLENLKPDVKREIWFERSMWKRFVKITFWYVEWLLQYEHADDRIFSTDNFFWDLDEADKLKHLCEMLPVYSMSRKWAKSSRSDFYSYFRFFKVQWFALYEYYKPKPCSVRLTYYRAAETFDDRSPGLWAGFTSGAYDVVTVPGTHISMIRGSPGRAFGQLLKRRILAASSV